MTTHTNHPPSLADLRAQLAAAEARPAITNAAELKAHHVANAEASVVAAEAKVLKLKDHLAGAIDGVDAAKAELEVVRATDYVFEAPQEQVTVRPVEFAVGS